MMVIDNPISFTEVKQAININKLKKGKAPGLTPKHSKQWTMSHDAQSIATYVIFSKARSTMKDGTKANVSLYQNKVT